MRLFSEVVARVRSLLDRRREDEELDEELRFHLEKEIQKKLAEGLTEGEARRYARIRLGGVDQVRVRTREARGTAWWEILRQSLASVARTAKRSPAFTVTIVLTLGLGIGANATMYPSSLNR